ncbi:MAG: hypothetical protein M3083_18065 [Actinomycetota bacterium]|nr:hypothetical protein [Actinomycetota bacterium]
MTTDSPIVPEGTRQRFPMAALDLLAAGLYWLADVVVNNLGLIVLCLVVLVGILGWVTMTHPPRYPEPPCCR